MSDAAQIGQAIPGSQRVASRMDFNFKMRRAGLKRCPECSTADDDVYHPANLCARSVRRSIITPDNLRQG
jgi:hypothetical protein